jgi:hypothetical protein
MIPASSAIAFRNSGIGITVHVQGADYDDVSREPVLAKVTHRLG